MQRLTTIVLLFSLLMIFSCTKKQEQSKEQEGQATMAEVEKFTSLSNEHISVLLNNAKEKSGDSTVDSTHVLSQSDIDAILTKVSNTQVEQIADNEIALLETSLGTLAIAFYTDIAPEHTRSFKRLVTAGYYNGTRFHRIIDNFMIQGGDLLTRDDDPDNDGTGGPGYNVPAEFSGLPHDLGILSMARAQDPNSAGSQFFICLSREGTRNLDGQYTVFGKVIGGLDVLKALGKVPTRPNNYGENSTPVEPVYLKNAYMVTR